MDSELDGMEGGNRLTFTVSQFHRNCETVNRFAKSLMFIGVPACHSFTDRIFISLLSDVEESFSVINQPLALSS